MLTHPLAFPTHAKPAQKHAQLLGAEYVAPKAKSSGDPQHDALVKQTQKWVSQTFFGEMLKQMRNSPFKNKMLDGGSGGQAFTQMFDQQMADKISSGSGKKLVDAIVSKIESGRAHDPAGQKPSYHLKKPAPTRAALEAKYGGK